MTINYIMDLIEDVIIHIAKLSDFRTLMRLSISSKFYNNHLNDHIKVLIGKIPWRLYIEYNTKNTINVGPIQIYIGYSDTLLPLSTKENYNLCLGNSSRKNSGKYIKMVVYHGKLNNLLDYLKFDNKLLITIHIDNKKKDVKLAYFSGEPKDGYYYLEEVISKVGNLDGSYQIPFAPSEIFDRVEFGNFPYNANIAMYYNRGRNEFYDGIQSITRKMIKAKFLK